MSDWSRGWPAPAKLNLMLRITGRRPDGYHELQTVFQFLDLCDELDFRVREDGEVRRFDPLPGVAVEADLTVRAARLLQDSTGAAPGVDIALRKRLPMGGGLGGGSSNAATVLHALNCLWECGLDAAGLATLGLCLGADVPVFVHGYAAWAEGVGECLRPINLPESWYLVIVPDCHVATGEIFSAPELTRNSCPIKISDFIAGDRRNDCLPVVRGRYPEVARAIEWLEEHAEARLTGTGGCVFAEFASASVAEQIRQQVPAGWHAWVARGCNCSPLREWTGT